MDGLSFTRALEIALNMEAAHRDTQQLRQSEPPVTSVSKLNVKQKSSQPARTEYYRCKGKNHSTNECYFKSTKCHKCDKFGHIQKACRASGPAAQGKRGNEMKNQQKVKGYVQVDDADDVLCVNEADGQAFKVNFAVNLKNVLIEIDTAAAVSMSEAIYAHGVIRAHTTRGQQCHAEDLYWPGYSSK